MSKPLESQEEHVGDATMEKEGLGKNNLVVSLNTETNFSVTLSKMTTSRFVTC